MYLSTYLTFHTIHFMIDNIDCWHPSVSPDHEKGRHRPDVPPATTESDLPGSWEPIVLVGRPRTFVTVTVSGPVCDEPSGTSKRQPSNFVVILREIGRDNCVY